MPATAQMRVSADIGVPIVKAFEGCLKPTPGGGFVPYRCPAGVLTIGYGHTNLGGVPPRVEPGLRWSAAECDRALVADMVRFEARVNRIMAGVTLSRHQFDALVSFDFNTGGLDRSSIPAKIRAGRLNEVPETLARWNKAGGRVLAGLTRRRKAEGELFAGKIDAALKTAGAARGGGAMPQTADRPHPTPAELATAAARSGKVGTVLTGVGTATGGLAAGGGAEGMPAAPFVLMAGLLFLVLGGALLARRAWAAARDWA